MSTIRLMLVEDARILRELLQSLFNEQPDIHVVAKASRSRAALVQACELDPDVVLLGTIHQPGNAVDLLRRLQTASPRSRVIVMDLGLAQPPTDYIGAGAESVVLPDTTIEALLYAVRKVGTTSQVPATQLDEMAPERNPEPLAAFARAFLMDPKTGHHLTRREEEIANLICDGRSNKEIASELHLSLHTVKTHVRRILEKLAVHSRLEIAAYGHRGPSRNGVHATAGE